MLLVDPREQASASAGARKALVAGADATGQLLLQSLLSREGYQVAVAESGREAVTRFEAAAADIVFMDLHMPDMDALEAARRIKTLSGQEFVPIIFVSAASETQHLVDAIAAGGDDFVTKPFDERVLIAKVRALGRIRRLHRSSARLHARAQADWEVAQSLLAEVVMGPNPRTAALHVDLTPTDTFSADVFLGEYGPSGDLNLLLGDFTGHGLAAALAALPTAEIFRSMTAKGFAPQQILLEINRKLCSQLPTGKFLAATFVQVSHSLERVWVANCGMPDVLLLSANGIRERIASSTLPLGVHSELDLGDCLRPLPVSPGDRLLLASDGVHEAINARGEQFGRTRMEQAAAGAASGGLSSAHIKAALDSFRGDEPIPDDSSLVEVLLVPALFDAYQAPARGVNDAATLLNSSGEWRMAIDLHAHALRVSDPVPMILSQLQEIPGLDEHRSVLYTVLSELYSNALEHGVLHLSSQLKEQPDGFERYLAAREQQLAALCDGWVRIGAVCAQWPGGGELRIKVEDSGAGFDWALQPSVPPTVPHGRGLCLVRALCRTLVFEDCGNRVSATYAWGMARSDEA